MAYSKKSDETAHRLQYETTPGSTDVVISRVNDSLDDIDLGGQIARDLKANSLLAHLRCVPDSHVFLLAWTSARCAEPVRYMVIVHIKYQSRSRF